MFALCFKYYNYIHIRGSIGICICAYIVLDKNDISIWIKWVLSTNYRIVHTYSKKYEVSRFIEFDLLKYIYFIVLPNIN